MLARASGCTRRGDRRHRPILHDGDDIRVGDRHVGTASASGKPEWRIASVWWKLQADGGSNDCTAAQLDALDVAALFSQKQLVSDDAHLRSRTVGRQQRHDSIGRVFDATLSDSV